MRIIRKILKSLLVPVEKILFEVVKSMPIGPLQKTVHIVRSDTIGDFVLFSATLPYYKKIYPGYKIVLIGDAVWKELALWVRENNIIEGQVSSYFDELIAVNGKNYNRNPFYYYKILKKIRLSAPEIALQPTFSRTEKSDRWILVSKESKKIGYEGDISNISATAKAKNDAKYDHLIENPISGFEPDKNKHFINELARRQIMESGLPHWVLPEKLLFEGRKALTSAGVDTQKPIVIICPNGSEADRTWTVENFVSLIENLHGQNALLQFMLIGGRRDVAKCLKIQESLAKEGLKVLNFCAKTSLPQLAEILSVSSLYLGAETGSMHMASAIGVPALVLRWQGHYERFFPYPAWRAGSENAVILQKRDQSDGNTKTQEAVNQAIKVLHNERGN